MAANRPGRGSDQFPLRLPDGLRAKIKETAAKNGRSMNTEILEVLQAWFDGGSDEPLLGHYERWSNDPLPPGALSIRDCLITQEKKIAELADAVKQLSAQIRRQPNERS